MSKMKGLRFWVGSLAVVGTRPGGSHFVIEFSRTRSGQPCNDSDWDKHTDAEEKAARIFARRIIGAIRQSMRGA